MTCVLALLVSLAVPTGGQRTEPLDERFEIAVGERVELPGPLRLTFREVTRDSRCPVDVQCIRAGEAEVVLEVAAPGSDAQSVTIDVSPGGEASTRLGDYTIQVTSLTPEASSTRKIESDEYRAELIVTSRSDGGQVDAPAIARVH